MTTVIIAPHRELKRVPLDFDWKQDEIWPGYCLRHPICMAFHGNDQCEQCEKFCKLVGLESKNICDDYKEIDPPTGEGYQMWETCTEGSPQSPVFKTLNELLRYCAGNCTIFGEEDGTIEDWRKVLIEREGTELFKDGNQDE